MSKPTFYIDKSIIRGKIATIHDPYCKQIRKVLRMVKGDKLDLIDGLGTIYEGTIETITNTEVKVVIENSRLEQPSTSSINLILGIPKIIKIDEIISRGTELGINRFLLCNAERSIKIEKLPEKKLIRWKKLSIEAIELSHRAYLPKVEFYHSASDVIASLKPIKANKLIAEIGAKERLSYPVNKPSSVIASLNPSLTTHIAIGPEGGWAPKEIELALSCGFRAISLGRYTLSTQSAVFYSVSILNFLLNNNI